jgi:hypothetical protein
MFASTTSMQSDKPSTSGQTNSSLSLGNYLNELSSDSESDSLNSSSSVIQFARDISKQREAAQALQLLSHMDTKTSDIRIESSTKENTDAQL